MYIYDVEREKQEGNVYNRGIGNSGASGCNIGKAVRTRT